MRNISMTLRGFSDRSSFRHFFAKTVTQVQDHYRQKQFTELTQIKTTHRTWQKCQTSLTGASLLSKLVCPGGEERIEGVERSVTIIPNMGGQESRRRSIADYAFPELHPDTALRRSSRNLLIYTRTRCLEMGTCTLFQFWKRSNSEIFTFPKYFQFCQ